MTAVQAAEPTASETPLPPVLAIAPAAFVLMWSTGFIAAKFGAPVAGPFSLLALRFVFVVPVLAALALVLRRSLPDRRSALHAMVAGALIHGLYLGGIFYAVKHGLPAGLSGLVVGLQPALTAIFARSLLGERLTGGHFAGLALGLVGVGMVLAPKLSGLDAVAPGVMAIAIAAVGAISLGTVYQKRFAASADLVVGTALQFVGASVVAVPLAVIEGFHYVPSWQLAGVVAWLVLVLSIGAVVLLLTMMKHGAVSKVASLFYLVPPTTALMAWLAFGETMTALQLVGVAVVIASVLILRPAARRRSGA